MTDSLAAVSEAGVSVWLDDLDRHRLAAGGLAALVRDSHVVGVTTNPTIFDKAISSGAAEYEPQLVDLATRGVTVEEAVRAITTYDVRWACDVLRPVFDATDGSDGRVSIEVDPRLGRHTAPTIAEARALWWMVDRPNLFIKIPATVEGLPAISTVIGEGISVNVTLIFSVERYRAVMDAWLTGLEAAAAKGLPLEHLTSVASFFVSRVDVAIDKQLDAMGTPDAVALRGEAAIANARLAWVAYQEVLSSDRWKALEAKGAKPQRPLWASTGVKDPAYKDTRYVLDLVAPGCVNTMPEGTLDAVADHGVFAGDTVSGTGPASQATFDALEKLGISLTKVFVELEDEGLVKFEDSWNQLLASLQESLDERKHRPST